LLVSSAVLERKIVRVTLKEALTKLDEVVLTPYNLSGDIYKDTKSLNIEPVITSSTLGLPNAKVKKLSLNERRLFLAMEEQGLHKLIDELTGHNKKLRKWVALDKEIKKREDVKKLYPDSVYSQELKIPPEKIDDFIYYCSLDSFFNSVVDNGDKLEIWEFLEKKSDIYRDTNNLE